MLKATILLSLVNGVLTVVMIGLGILDQEHLTLGVLWLVLSAVLLYELLRLS